MIKKLVLERSGVEKGLKGDREEQKGNGKVLKVDGDTLKDIHVILQFRCVQGPMRSYGEVLKGDENDARKAIKGN